jgi:hypothetical protein
MEFAARRYDRLGRRMQVVIGSVINIGCLFESGRPRQSARLRYHSGAIYNNLREMAELSLLKERYPAVAAENRLLARQCLGSLRSDDCDLAGQAARWMKRCKIRSDFTAANPEEFGMEPSSVVSAAVRNRIWTLVFGLAWFLNFASAKDPGQDQKPQMSYP